MKKWLFVLICVLALVGAILAYTLRVKVDTVQNSSLVNFESISEVDFRKLDSVQVIATNFYESDDLKNLLQGEHYRDAWSTPIKVPVVFLDTQFGGVSIVDEGGGKQTKSLKLKDNNGVIYALRSINKDPTPLIPEIAKTLSIENIVTDGVSAQHPYGAIPVAALAKVADVLTTHPKVVFLPKQKLLGEYNIAYGNKLYLLEFETEGKVNWTHYKDAIELVDTDRLIQLKNDRGERLQLESNLLVRNRLFDLLIGDWDRHAKQWGWVIIESNDIDKAIPLGCDRDNAFFSMEGIIPTIISNPALVKELRSFEDDIAHMSGLVQPFDRYFLLGVDKEVFINEAKVLQAKFTDEAIDEALRVWPEAFYKLDGAEIKIKMISRREKLQDYAVQFHKLLNQLGPIDEPLKGCDQLDVSQELSRCFQCK